MLRVILCEYFGNKDQQNISLIFSGASPKCFKYCNCKLFTVFDIPTFPTKQSKHVPS